MDRLGSEESGQVPGICWSGSSGNYQSGDFQKAQHTFEKNFDGFGLYLCSVSRRRFLGLPAFLNPAPGRFSKDQKSASVF